MIEKEIGGNSSPVNSSGIKMMSDIFHKTNDLAMILASKRKSIYEKLLNIIICNVFIKFIFSTSKYWNKCWNFYFNSITYDRKYG